MKVIIKDYDQTATKEYVNAVSVEDYARLCFDVLLAMGCDPQNLCNAFALVAEEIEKAWFGDGEKWNDSDELEIRISDLKDEEKIDDLEFVELDEMVVPDDDIWPQST